MGSEKKRTAMKTEKVDGRRRGDGPKAERQ